MASKKRLILSIDGGGIRGIIPGQFIVKMEEAFKINVAEEFDLCAGTSTGGILTCAYLFPNGSSGPKYTSEEVVDLYLKNGDKIFDIPFFHKIRSLGGVSDEKYPSDGIEGILNTYFGDIWLKDLLKPTVITSYDILRRKGHFFKQQKAVNSPDYNFKVKDVARATSAAPTYFECAKITNELGGSAEENKFPLIDGGVFVNNPALAAYAEGRNILKNDDDSDCTAKDMKILSLGTGFTRKPYHYDKAKNWGMAQWVQPVIDVMMSGGAEVADYQLKAIYDSVDEPEQYLRANIDLKDYGSVDPDIDNATQENMEQLQEVGNAMFESHRDQLERWLEL